MCPWFWVSAIGEESLHPCRLVAEGEGELHVGDGLWKASEIRCCLFNHAAQCDALGLRLDDADRLAIHKEQVVCKSRFEREFAYGDTEGCTEIQIFVVLYRPSCGYKQLIDIYACLVLWFRAITTIMYSITQWCFVFI